MGFLLHQDPSLLSRLECETVRPCAVSNRLCEPVVTTQGHLSHGLGHQEPDVTTQGHVLLWLIVWSWRHTVWGCWHALAPCLVYLLLLRWAQRAASFPASLFQPFSLQWLLHLLGTPGVARAHPPSHCAGQRAASACMEVQCPRDSQGFVLLALEQTSPADLKEIFSLRSASEICFIFWAYRVIFVSAIECFLPVSSYVCLPLLTRNSNPQ